MTVHVANACAGRVLGIFWKCARVGERLSPYVSLCCVVMAVRTEQRCVLVIRRHCANAAVLDVVDGLFMNDQKGGYGCWVWSNGAIELL